MIWAVRVSGLLKEILIFLRNGLQASSPDWGGRLPTLGILLLLILLLLLLLLPLSPQWWGAADKLSGPPPPSYSLYIISSSPSKSCRAHFLRWFRCGGTEIDKNIHSFFSMIPFWEIFFDAYLHLTVMIACLRLDSQFSAVNFCAQAADLVSSRFPIWAFG